MRRKESRGDTTGQLRFVLVNDGNRGVMKSFRHASSRRVDPYRETVRDQYEHGRVAQETPQFLHPEPVNIGEVAHVQRSCFFSRTSASPRITGTANNIGQKKACRSAKFSALLNTPRL